MKVSVWLPTSVRRAASHLRYWRQALTNAWRAGVPERRSLAHRSLVSNLLKRIDPAAWVSLRNIVQDVSKGRDVVLHGTRRARQILLDDRLLYSRSGSPRVSFTRSPRIAAYGAFLPVDPDEPAGAVLIFDKQKLTARYRLEPTRDPFWDDLHRNDEAEEKVWGQDVFGLRSMLLGVAWTDGQLTSAAWQPGLYPGAKCTQSG